MGETMRVRRGEPLPTDEDVAMRTEVALTAAQARAVAALLAAALDLAGDACITEPGYGDVKWPLVEALQAALAACGAAGVGGGSEAR